MQCQCSYESVYVCMYVWTVYDKECVFDMCVLFNAEAVTFQ